MNVSEAVERRRSIRAFLPDPVSGEVVRALLDAAHRAPSGGNLQPWRVYALSGEPLAAFKSDIAARLQDSPGGEGAEYQVYPKDLPDPHRARRFQVGEDMYATLGVERENKLGRLMQFARNFAFFDAPVGLFFCVHRRMGPPQWSDLGMYMQTLMLLAVEQGLDTCAQEAWSIWPKTVARHLNLDSDHMLFSGMALGRRDPSAPINTLRSRREPFDAFAEMRGF